MGTTPTYALPYPEPSAKVIAGATDMRLLAEAVDADLAAVAAQLAATGTSWAATEATSAPVQNLAANTAALATFGALSGTGHFGSDGSTLSYATGTTRLFLVTAHVTFTTGTSVSGTWMTTANLVANGAVVMGSRHMLTNPQVDTEDDFTANHPHALTWLAQLSPGDSLALQLTSTRAGTAINKGIAVAGFGHPL